MTVHLRQVLLVLGQALMVLAFTGCALFVITYQLRARWWRSNVGLNQMLFAASETAVLGLSLLAMVLGDSLGMQIVGLVAFAAFTAVSWWRWVVLLKAQRTGRDEPHS